MNRSLPTIAMLLGIAGLIPFAVCGLGALANAPPNDEWALLALVAYGAVILAFLGGVHWGFGLDAVATAPSDIQRARFGLGVLPALVGWVTLLIAFLGFPLGALALLAVGVLLTTIVEARASRRGYVPRGYMGLRFVLSSIVLIILVTVWLILILHGRVVLW
jgi:hypothetical protein